MSAPVPALAANIEQPAGTPIHPADAQRVKLFQPFRQKCITMHNRLGVSPMCMYSSVDGHLNDYHILHYGSLALKGPGLVIIEASAIVPEGRITPQDSGLWSDAHIPALKRVVDVIKSQGSTPGIQVAHAGRKASCGRPFEGDYLVSEADGGWPDHVVGPSANAYAPHYAKPHALTIAEIKQTVQYFADAAVRADKAGVEVLEIHAAHGYLLSSFFSGNSNKRTDAYGGSFENRIRFGLQVVKAVRAVWPLHKPLWVRISCAEYVNPDPMGGDPNGWDIYQSCKLAKEFKKLGVDMVDCSSGGNIHGVKYPSAPMYQVQFSEAIKREADIQTAAVGLIVEGTDAEEILEKGQADYILAAREFLRNSAFVLVAAQALDVDIQWNKQYSWAVKKARRHNTTKPDDSKHGNAEKMTSIP